MMRSPHALPCEYSVGLGDYYTESEVEKLERAAELLLPHCVNSIDIINHIDMSSPVSRDDFSAINRMICMNVSSFLHPNFAEEFARAWIANWNKRDVDAILAHFADDCVFESPLAQRVVAQPIIRGKKSLEAYWRAAVVDAGAFTLSLDHASWDPVRRTLLVVYQSQKGKQVTHACEVMMFNEAGQQTTGKAFYGFSIEAS